MKKINFKKILKNNKSKYKPQRTRTPKPRKTRNKKFSKKIFNLLLILVTLVAIFLIIGAIGLGYYIVKSAPEFDEAKLYEKEATIIYDSQGVIRATLGVEKREKISYNDIPEVLIDAVVATEDARFFQHNGFDLPRFLKASIGQALGKSDAGGASTLTMQISKNTFTSLEARGIQGIIRKFTDIYMAIFKIEKHYTKEEIMEFYLNAPYLGSGSYGIEQASQTFFGKHVKDISLPEAALLAGLFQAPGEFDPYINPEAAEARRNIVLNLMVRHGYISKEERDIAKKIKVKDLIRSDYSFNINPYVGFIDTVVQEVRDVTGSDPYMVPMEIYSTMVTPKQDVINNLYNGNLGYKFKDDKIQLGIGVIDNKTGAIIAVGAGRNKTKEMTFNYATMTNAHPGSTAKPIFEYGAGIENEKWSTYTPFFDEKNTTYSSGKNINNWNSLYEGITSLKDCLVKSKNTCALQAFQRLDNKVIYDFATSLGIKPESEDGFLHEAHAVGAFNGVSPVQLAAAYSAFASGGYYTKPYSFTKIVYRDTGEEFETDISRDRVMSAQTAYLMTNVLYGVTPSVATVSGTNVATKTGTSSYESDVLKSLGLSSDVIRDSWVATYSPDYTISFWYGYDELNKEYVANKWFNYMGAATTQRRTIQGLLCRHIFEKNSKFSNPGGIVIREVEFGTIPAQLPSEFTPSNLIKSFMFISGTEPTEVSTRYSKLANPTNVQIEENGNTINIKWNSPGIPSAIDPVYLKSYFDNGFGKWADKYYNERIQYNNAYIGEFGFDIYLVKGADKTHVGWTKNTEKEIYLNEYPISYDSILIKSSYSIFKANASSGVTKNLSSSSDVVNVTLKTPISLSVGSEWNGSGKSDILKLILNGEEINPSDYTGVKLHIQSITKSGQSVAIDNITDEPGTYTVIYNRIEFNYMLLQPYNKAIIFTQTVNVS